MKPEKMNESKRRIYALITIFSGMIFFFLFQEAELFRFTKFVETNDVTSLREEPELTSSETKVAKRTYEGYQSSDEETCKWWNKQFRLWNAAIDRKRGVEELIPFVASQHRSGTGDRLVGLEGALYLAMRQEIPLDVYWPDLNAIFSLPDNVRYIDTKPVNLCETDEHYSCSLLRHKKCHVFNRGCLGSIKCINLVKAVGGNNIQTHHVVGCPLRQMLQPTKTFLKSQVHWFLNGKTHSGSIDKLFEVSQSYLTIALHIRVGDAALVSKRYKVGDIETNREISVVEEAVSCLDIVTKYFESIDEQGRQVKWVVASDDSRIRGFFEEHHANKVLMLDFSPKHIQTLKKHNETTKIGEMTNLFAEWFLIGRSEQLVTNLAHSFGVSAFSRTAWAYHLKSIYFEIGAPGQCERKEFMMNGNLGKINKECKLDVKNRTTPQIHL
eukprot:snap_masked-scaffold_32-processed-gene-2.12-mRNA-1 protein AED:1.00 eAED:1.00 QI:0/-1/0/0/-1/1/1/0/439